MIVNGDSRLANRHPDIVLITHSEEEVQGVIEIIKEQFDSFRCIVKCDATLEVVYQLQPKVIMFSLATVKDNITLYTLMIKGNILNQNHYSILLCKNKESSLAFGCCLRNLFNSYFVHQPLYEKYRLKLIVYEGLIRCEVEQNFYDELVGLVNKQDSELNELIEQGLDYKKHVLDKIGHSKEEVERIKQQVKEEEHGDVKQALLDMIQNEHLQPLFSALEAFISENLLDMLQKMSSLQTSLREAQHINPSQGSAPDFKPLQEEEIKERDKHILVVEDNHIYRDMVSDVLTQEGYIVDKVDDGMRAINKIKTELYDLILMDLFMPNLDGLNTTKHIRKVGKNKKTPVVALSGNKKKDIVRKWASHGLAGYIVKPSTKTEILNVIDRLVK